MSSNRPRTGFPYPGFPEGWFQVGWDDDLADGEVRPLRYFGRDLVMYRSRTDRSIAVLDAHCPHMGAHLGHGGWVENDCVVSRSTDGSGVPTGPTASFRCAVARPGSVARSATPPR